MRHFKFLAVTLLSVLVYLAACGGPPEEVETTHQAVNEGQVCGGTYDPFGTGQGWPTRGWCQWMQGPHGTNSPACVSGGPAAGEIYLLNGPVASYTKCARIPADSVLDFRYLAFNGWDNQLGSTLYYFKYAWLGPHTLWQYGNDPFFGSESYIANYTDSNTNWVYGPITSTNIINSFQNYSYGGGPLD